MTALFLVAAVLLGASQDGPYSDSATAALVARAQARHAVQDTLVRDYQATVRSRFDVALGRSRFGRSLPFFASEHVARIQWAYPNDLRVEVLGQRGRTLLGRDARAEVRFTRPWFIARGLGDSIRLVEDGRLPERAALHPFAPGAERYYRFAIADSASVRLPQRVIEAVGVEVRPRQPGPSLIAGHIWVDRSTAEVVRMSFFFLGDYLWSQPRDATPRDSAAARRRSRTAARALRVEAEIEYALYEQRFWMPYGQRVTVHLHDPWVTGAVAPVRVVTTFADYRINAGEPIRFSLAVPDTVTERPLRDTTEAGVQIHAGRRRAGGRWELVTPSSDSLHAYDGWPDTMVFAVGAEDERRFRELAAELGRLAEELPGPWLGRGGLHAARWGDALRFNRVQGLSLGATYVWEPPLPFTTVSVRARYGITDSRLLVGGTVRRDAPDGTWELAGGRRLADADPFSAGSGFANTVNALFAGHDDADYLLASGVRLAYRRRGGRHLEWTADAGIEHHRSVPARAESRLHDFFFGDGLFQRNPPVREGWHGVGTLSLDRRSRLSAWRLGADWLAAEALVAGRVWGELSRWLGPVRAGVLAGAATRDDVPQMLLRAGGPRTVRGHGFGTRAGEAMWAAQVEVALRGRRLVTPVVFADVGNAGSFDSVFVASPLIGVGVGLSVELLVTELRLALSKSVGVHNDEKLRFDLLFRPSR